MFGAKVWLTQPVGSVHIIRRYMGLGSDHFHDLALSDTALRQKVGVVLLLLLLSLTVIE